MATEEKRLLNTTAPPPVAIDVPPAYEKSNTDTSPAKNENNRDVRQELQYQERPKKWGFGFFDCFEDCFEDCFTFLCAAACPAIVYGQNKQRAAGDEECCLYTGLFCIVDSATGRQCGCVLASLERQQIRNRQEIPGSLLEDLVVSSICLPCSLGTRCFTHPILNNPGG